MRTRLFRKASRCCHRQNVSSLEIAIVLELDTKYIIAPISPICKLHDLSLLFPGPMMYISCFRITFALKLAKKEPAVGLF